MKRRTEILRRSTGPFWFRLGRRELTDSADGIPAGVFTLNAGQLA